MPSTPPRITARGAHTGPKPIIFKQKDPPKKAQFPLAAGGSPAGPALRISGRVYRQPTASISHPHQTAPPDPGPPAAKGTQPVKLPQSPPPSPSPPPGRPPAPGGCSRTAARSTPLPRRAPPPPPQPRPLTEHAAAPAPPPRSAPLRSAPPRPGNGRRASAGGETAPSAQRRLWGWRTAAVGLPQGGCRPLSWRPAACDSVSH